MTGGLSRLSDGVYVGDGPIQGGLGHSFGPTAVIDVDGIEILVVSEAQQMVDLQQLRAFGIEPTDRRVLVLKSMQHFRAAFGPIAGRIIVCDAGLATPRAERRPNTHVPRPLWPLDKDFERVIRPFSCPLAARHTERIHGQVRDTCCTGKFRRHLSHVPVTRQMTSPTSSAINTAPSAASATPTGRP
ncbi:MlrC C-terminal domain-containing protein [Phyllobacterium sp. K27]